MDAKIQNVGNLDQLSSALDSLGAALKTAPLMQGTFNAQKLASTEFDTSPLRGLVRHLDSLPSNWSGPSIDETKLTDADRQDYAKVKESFAEVIKGGICFGMIRIAGSNESGIYEIDFPRFIGAGSGAAAAQLLEATLRDNGANAVARGTSVHFSVSTPSDHSSMTKLLGLVDMVGDVRSQELKALKMK